MSYILCHMSYVLYESYVFISHVLYLISYVLYLISYILYLMSYVLSLISYVIRESQELVWVQGASFFVLPCERVSGNMPADEATTSLRCASYWCWLRADHMLTVATFPLLSLSQPLNLSLLAPLLSVARPGSSVAGTRRTAEAILKPRRWITSPRRSR